MARALYQAFPMLEESRAQVWTYSPRYRRPRHFHSEPELNLVVAGTATFGVGDAVKTLGAGELLTFAPGQDHALLEGSPDLALFAVGLRAEFAFEARADAASLSGPPLYARLAPEHVAELVARCADATGRAGAEQSTTELWQAALFAAKTPRAHTTTPHVLTRRALAVLEQHPEATRAELARCFRADASDVSRHFHRDLGLTLASYRTRARLLRLVSHVDRGASLTSAALDAGFGSYSQCHRAFHAQLACSPRDFFFGSLRRQLEDAFLPVAERRLTRCSRA